MRKRIIHITNWEKWQARSDKELPWMKLWGRLFKSPWLQVLTDSEKFCVVAFLDLARQFNNQIDAELVFKGYFRMNYGITSLTDKDILKLCKYLRSNNFLSDNCLTNVRLEGDKIRQDKIRYPTSPSADTFTKNEEKKVSLKDIAIKGLEEPAKHKLYNGLVEIFSRRGWRTDVDFLKPVFRDVAGRLEGYNPKNIFPYFKKAISNFINHNAEYLSKNKLHEQVNMEVVSMASMIGKKI